jgi:hypothetical protein
MCPNISYWQALYSSLVLIYSPLNKHEYKKGKEIYFIMVSFTPHKFIVKCRKMHINKGSYQQVKVITLLKIIKQLYLAEFTFYNK